MRLTLDVDLSALGDQAPEEAARILRYWAGALPSLDLGGTGGETVHPLMDSAYQQVGELRIVEVTSGAGDAETGSHGGVKEALHRYLRSLHTSLLWKIDGLGERDARWPMTPTGTNLLGLVKHVASVESEYFGFVVDRPFPEELPWSADDAEDNADMWAWEDETIGSVRGFAERVWAHADATIEALDLEATGRVPWWGEGEEVTFAAVLVHVVVETARHLGQADIVRELTDGASGLSPRFSNLPDHDEQWWSDYVERLKRVAAAAETRGSA